jgi:hypothetical protein
LLVGRIKFRLLRVGLARRKTRNDSRIKGSRFRVFKGSSASRPRSPVFGLFNGQTDQRTN